MSEAIEVTEETGPALEPVADSADENATQGGGDDFWGRVASDGEFAVDQVRKRDARTSELSNRLESLKTVEKMVEMAGSSDALLSFAQKGARIDQIPGLADIVQKAFETGRVELTQATPDDANEEAEWMDPDVKAAVDPLKAEIASLKEMLGQLSGQTQAASVRSMETHVQSNIEAALSEFKQFGDEAFEEARQILQQRVKNTMERAEKGDAQAASLIEQISQPGGQDILDGVLMKKYKENVAKVVAGSSSQEPNEQKAPGRSTDERNTTVSQPGPPGLPPVPKGKVKQDFVMKVCDQAARNAGYDPNTL